MRGTGIATQNTRARRLMPALLTLAVGCALAHRDDGSRALPEATLDAGHADASDAGPIARDATAPSTTADAGGKASALRAAILEPSGDVSVDAGGFLDFRGACSGPGPIVRQHWDVSGLATTGEGANFTHVSFADEGGHTVTLLCTDASGARATASLRVSVWRVPSVAFTAVAGPSIPKWSYVPSDDAYIASANQLGSPRQISPTRTAAQDVLPRVGQPSYDADAKQVLAIAAYRSTYDEALLITPCRGAAGCDQSQGIQPLLHAPLEVRYAQWAPDYQSIVVAGEHDVYLVPVHSGVAGQEIHLSSAFADPADLDGQDVDKPNPALLFVGHGRALAFRTRAKADILPIGLSIVDVATSLASGAAVMHQVSLDLPTVGTDVTSLGDLIAAPDDGNLAFTSVDRQWAGPVLQSAYTLDVDAWLADPTTLPTQLPAGASGHAINQLSVGNARLWVYELADSTSASNLAGRWVSYRWDGSDPVPILERWPAFTWLAACGDYAVDDVVTTGAALQVLQATAPSTLASMAIDVGPHQMTSTGFSPDCRYALFRKEDDGLVVVDLVSHAVWFGPAYTFDIESAVLDPGGQYLLASDRFGPRHLLNIQGNQLSSVFETQKTYTLAVFSHGAFYSLSDSSVFQPMPSELLRIPLDGSNQVQSLGTFGTYADGLVASPVGDEITVFPGHADGVSTNLGGLLQLAGGVSWQLLPLPAAPGGAAGSLTPLANRALLMSGNFTQLEVSELYSVQTDVGGATRRQTPAGFQVDEFYVAPNQQWFTAWQLTSGQPDDAVVSAFGLDLSTDSSGARGSISLQSSAGQLIQDSFTPVRVNQQAAILGSDGRVRTLSSDPTSYVRAVSASHAVVSSAAPSAGQDILLDVNDTSHRLVLPDVAGSGAGAWFSPNEQWLLYTAGSDATGAYHWRSVDLASHAISDLEAPDGSPLPADLSDPQFTPDGRSAFIQPSRVAVNGVWQCAGALLVRQGARRAVAADGTGHSRGCGVFVSPDSSHFAFDSDGLYVAEVAHPEHAQLVGPVGAGNVCFSPDARHLVYFVGPYTAPYGPGAVVDLQHPQAPAAPLLHAVPYSLTFDRSGRRVLGSYQDGWERGFAVWPMDAPSQAIRVGPAGWSVDSAVWVE
jgi:hypothetical protein